MLIRSIWDPRIDEVMERARCRARDGHRDRTAAGGEAVTPGRPYPSPPDWRAHWIYFLLLDRFDNPHRPPALPWDAETLSPQGGTFEGVRSRLGYLRELGAGALWLSPFLKEREFCYGYGVQDFLSVDPRYGTEDDLVRLIDEAHAHGLYVIADVVVHHAGDVFAYRHHDGLSRLAAWSDTPYPIVWRDEHGLPRWEEAPAECHADAAVWPLELRNAGCFRRRGWLDPCDPVRGDLHWLKEFDPAHVERRDAGGRSSWSVQDVLIRIYQYWIAKLDIDGLRLDSLKHVERDVAKRFSTAVREFAGSIGKANFLLLGEVRGGIDAISPYVGKDAGDPEGRQIADSCILFPFSTALREVVKEGRDCRILWHGHREWARSLADRCRGAGDPVSYMVTMIDDHDTTSRFFDGEPAGEDDVLMALAWLFASPGTPCIYYGTEQGLHGRASEEARRGDWLFEGVREALWGKPGAFDPRHRFFQVIKALATLRHRHAGLTFGRTYWRPVARDGRCFSFDDGEHGLLALSRINEPEEVLIVSNWNRREPWQGAVLIDVDGNAQGRPWTALFSSRWGPPGQEEPPPRYEVEQVRDATLRDGDGADTGRATVHALRVEVGPREILILGQLSLA